MIRTIVTLVVIKVKIKSDSYYNGFRYFLDENNGNVADAIKSCSEYCCDTEIDVRRIVDTYDSNTYVRQSDIIQQARVKALKDIHKRYSRLSSVEVLFTVDEEELNSEVKKAITEVFNEYNIL